MSLLSLTIASGILAFGITNAVSPLLNTTTHSDDKCAPQKIVEKILLEKYSEISVAGSIDATSGYLIEFYITQHGETWSIVGTDPLTKISCILLNGENWQSKNINFNKKHKLK